MADNPPKTFKIRDKETGEVFTVRERSATPVKRKPDAYDELLPTFLAERFGRGPADFQGGNQNIFGDVFDRPGAAVRSAIRAPMGQKLQAFQKGSVDPKSVPTFLEQSQKAPVTPDIPFTGAVGARRAFQNFLAGYSAYSKGLARDAAAVVADVATNPADILTGIGGKSVFTKLSKTPAGRHVLKFLTKPRKFFKLNRKTLQEVAEAAGKGKRHVLDKQFSKYDDLFDEMGDSVKGTTDADDIVQAINDHVDTFPDSPGTAKLKKISKRLSETPEISAKELHNVKQEIRKVVPKSVWRGTSQADAIQSSQRKLYFKVGEKIEALDTSGKYKGLTQEYRELMNTIDDVNSAILERGRPGELMLRTDAPTLGRLFNPEKGLTFRQIEALKKLDDTLPNKMKFMQDFNAWKRGILMRDAVIGIGAAGLLYGARRKVGERVLIDDSPRGGGGG